MGDLSTGTTVLLGGAGTTGRRVVRCSWFDQNFSEGHLRGPILAGELALPVDAVREPFLDTDDIGDVVFAALTGRGHEGVVHELTGPHLLTFAEAVAGIAARRGTPPASCRSRWTSSRTAWRPRVSPPTSRG